MVDASRALTSPEEKMGAKDALCKVATMNIGLEDTLAYYTPEE